MWPDAPPRDVSVRADEHDAAPLDSVQVVPGSGVEDVDVERNARGARKIGGGTECSLARRVSERDEGAAEQIEGRAPVAEPEMRGPMTRRSHRLLTDRVPGARRGRVIGCDDSRLEYVSQREPVDRIRRSRGAQARVGAGDRVPAALRLVALEQHGAG